MCEAVECRSKRIDAQKLPATLSHCDEIKMELKTMCRHGLKHCMAWQAKNLIFLFHSSNLWYISGGLGAGVVPGREALTKVLVKFLPGQKVNLVSLLSSGYWCEMKKRFKKGYKAYFLP